MSIGNGNSDGSTGSVLVAIHALKLREGIEADAFLKAMSEEFFAKADGVPKGIDRGGRSVVKSQHLLANDSDNRSFLWLIKRDKEVFSPEVFREVARQMLEEIRSQLEVMTVVDYSVVYTVVDSFDAGPRDTNGRPLAEPQRGSFI